MKLSQVLVAGTCVLMLCGRALAQSESATLSGQVLDQSKAAIPKAEIEVVNINTGVPVRTTTNEQGIYVVPNLKPGNYRLSIHKPGFRAIEEIGIVLHAQDYLSDNLTLQVGSVSESMTIYASSPVINTTDASVSTTIDRQFVGNLPLNGRSFQSLIFLTPGVVPTTSTDTEPGEFSVNGQRQNANYFTVDGVSANTGVFPSNDPALFSLRAGGAVPGLTALGTTASLVSVDALEEFKIQSSTYSAEFGRQPGAQVQLVTRSGNNQFHGTAFEYLRNDAMDGQDWFDASIKLANAQAGLPFQKPELRQNQFGGTFGGPIFKSKTFFFFSYEGQRLRIPQASQAQVVPAVWLRKAAAPGLQPWLNANPLPNGPDILDLEDPTMPPSACMPGQAPPACNPLVDSGFATVAGASSNPASVDAYSIRVDHSVNDKLRLFGRYAQTPSSSLNRFLNQLLGTVSSSHDLTLGATFVATPRLSNEFRFNYTSSDGTGANLLDNFGGAVPVTASQLVAPYSGPGPVQASSEFTSPFGPIFANPYFVGPDAANRQRQLNFVDNISWAKGRHQLKFGADWRHLTPVFGPTGYLLGIGSACCPATQTEFFQTVASGTVTVFIVSNKEARPIYNNRSAFAEDTWRLAPRLTLDLGLRWEVNPAPHDANGLKPVLVTGITGIDTSKATLAPPGTPFYKTIYTAFAPRVGVAYQLSQASGRETVLRAGFGLFYDLGSEQGSAGFGGFPFTSFTFLPSVTLPLSPAQAQQPPFPATVTLPLASVFDSAGTQLPALNPHLKLPYTLDWSLALERALGTQQTLTLSYVGSAARRLTITQFINAIPDSAPCPSPPCDQFRPNPNFGDILFTRNAPSSDYESFQAQFQRRLSRGLQALVSYTWSHAIDEASFNLDVLTSLARSNADSDVRHNLSIAATYDFPKLHGTGPLAGFRKAITNGWSVDSIFFARTGLPLDVIVSPCGFAGCFQAHTGRNGNTVIIRPDVVPGQPIWISNPMAPGGQQLNVNAFALPPSTPCPGCLIDPIFQQGDLARNSILIVA